MTIDLISRFKDPQVFGWLLIRDNDYVRVFLNGKHETTKELFDALSEQLNTLGCRVSVEPNSMAVKEFLHLSSAPAFCLILEEELQKAGVIIQSQE